MCDNFLKMQFLVQLFCLISAVTYFIARGVKSACKTVYKHLDMRTVLIVNLLFVLVNIFFVVMQLNKFLWPPESYFQSPLSETDRTNMFEILDVFRNLADRANITYFMSAGTLIGSYRHLGPIPWDDDIDIHVKSSQKQLLIDTIKKLGSKYALYATDDLSKPTDKWKFYMPTSSRSFIHRPFTWPYVDLFFYRENTTHVWDEQREWVFPKTTIFPLYKRPFGDMWLYSPCNSSDFLSSYSVHNCQSRSFSHLLELPLFMWRQRIVECSRLTSTFPFVFRNNTKERKWRLGGSQTTPVGPVHELLRIGDYTLKKAFFTQPVCDGVNRRVHQGPHLLQAGHE